MIVQKQVTETRTRTADVVVCDWCEREHVIPENMRGYEADIDGLSNGLCISSNLIYVAIDVHYDSRHKSKIFGRHQFDQEQCLFFWLKSKLGV